MTEFKKDYNTLQNDLTSKIMKKVKHDSIHDCSLTWCYAIDKAEN
jgi:hypothetical protein